MVPDRTNPRSALGTASDSGHGSSFWLDGWSRGRHGSAQPSASQTTSAHCWIANRKRGSADPADLDRFDGSLDDLHAHVIRSGSGEAPPPLPFDLSTTAGLQHALNFLGASPLLTVHGILGPHTRSAVQALQRANRLTRSTA